ncbi:MAG: hypothetical protein KA745_00240 [Gemmatimonadales bacterium]|nr:hypothetical protein [Gemmatimonadales bacterium]
MRLRCITPPDPAAPLVSVEAAKVWLRVSGHEEDDLIAGLVASAVGHLDGWTGILGRALAPQVWELTLEELPPGAIDLPLGPVMSVASLAWQDAAGALHALDASAWRLVAPGMVRGRVVPVAAWPWPAEAVGVVVRWEAGEGCPAPVRTAILMLVAHGYANREAVGVGGTGAQAQIEVPLGVAALIAPWRVTAL